MATLHKYVFTPTESSCNTVFLHRDRGSSIKEVPDEFLKEQACFSKCHLNLSAKKAFFQV